MVWHLLSWYLLLIFLGWVSFPLAYRLFRRLPDRGYTFSRILGLLLWGFLFWLLTSLGILQNQPGGILFALALLLSLSAWAGRGHWHEIQDWVKTHGRLILVAELVFTLSFGFMLLVRASVPDATGTEKPMELAFINAVIRSKRFPPHDPWLAGYAISYYHFGYILAGMLAVITGASGGVAFNLMVVAVFAMSAVGAYGALFNLLSAERQGTGKSDHNLGWALFGPLFLLFISNLEAILESLYQAGVGWREGATSSPFWNWVNIESFLTPPSPPLTLIPQRYWWWWQASRVVQDVDLLGVTSPLSPIDEFPAFSFVLGDLHPHVLVMPFVMLLIGLALNVFWGAMDQPGKLSGIRPPYQTDLFLLSAVLLGGIAFLNTWDLPVYFTLLVGAYLLRKVQVKGWGWSRLTETLQLAIPLGIVSLCLYLPFLISFQSQAGGILPNILYPTRGLYLWLMFSALFVPIFLLLGWLWRRRQPAWWGWGSMVVFSLLVLLIALSIGLGLVAARMEIGQQVIASQGETTAGGLLAAATLHRLRHGVSLLTLLALLIGSLSFLLGGAQPDEPITKSSFDSLPFVLWLIFLGGVMVLAPEFVYLQDNFGTRMNTVFKFYYQAWMLWSLAAAFAAVRLIRSGGRLARVMIVILILLGLVYPIFAYPDRAHSFQPAEGFRLDAGAYLAMNQPDEAAGIDWLAGAPHGVVAEAVGGQYSGYARVATLSGQPTVLGWPGHEGQWRGGYEEVGSREADIRTLYETADWETAASIIRKYDIRYIFVGTLEMSAYALNPVKFEQNLQAGFEQGATRIFVAP